MSSSPLCVRICWIFQGVGGVENIFPCDPCDPWCYTTDCWPWTYPVCPLYVCPSKGCVPPLSVCTKCYTVSLHSFRLCTDHHWPPWLHLTVFTRTKECSCFVGIKITALFKVSGLRSQARSQHTTKYIRVHSQQIQTVSTSLIIRITFCACKHSWQHRAERHYCPLVSELALKIGAFALMAAPPPSPPNNTLTVF